MESDRHAPAVHTQPANIRPPSVETVPHNGRHDSPNIADAEPQADERTLSFLERPTFQTEASNVDTAWISDREWGRKAVLSLGW